MFYILSLIIIIISMFSFPTIADEKAISFDFQPMENSNETFISLKLPDNSAFESKLNVNVADAGNQLALQQPKSEEPMMVVYSSRNKTDMTLMTTGLLLLPLDRMLVNSFTRDPSNQGKDDFTEFINMFGQEFLMASIAGIYVLGDEYDKETARYMLAAVANASLMTESIKRLTGRERPNSSNLPGKFHGPEINGGYLSFPSGHTSAAFAAAKVLAERHPKQKWLYYGMAAGVGIARIRKSSHFPSDVLVGAGIGIYQGGQVLSGSPSFLSIKF